MNLIAHGGLFIQKLEVISLRTSGKRLPGKKLAVYNGAVIAVLVLAYNLTKDLSFILFSDKEGILKLCFLEFKYQTDELFLERSAPCSEIVLVTVSV